MPTSPPHLSTPIADRSLEVVVHLRDTTLRSPVPRAGTLTFGRSTRCDVCIEHGSVSREHARLHNDDGLSLEDLNSSNGTWLYEAESESGSELTMGAARETRLEPGVRHPVDAGSAFRVGTVLVVFRERLHLEAGSGPTLAPSLRAGPRFSEATSDALVRDAAMAELYELATRAAQTEITVLINGETGAGKEVLADTIHRRSKRASGPFLRLNCAALTESILESELFGHEKGAFTGANSVRLGLLESTNGGTVFLDEIGELPLTTQAKLLRVLEERAVIRVGGSRARPIDVRIICATNRELRREVRRGRFREDLYFRINSLVLSIPPLRDRTSEIEPLARHFLQQFCQRSNLPVPSLTPAALAQLQSYPWPGNVRELKNAMERAPFLAGNGPIDARHLPQLVLDSVGPETDDTTRVDLQVPRFAPPPSFPGYSAPRFPGTSSDPTPSAPLVSDSLDLNGLGPTQSERERILKALELCGGNQTRAAKLLGISRRTLINRLDSMNLPRPKKPTGE